VVAVEKIVYIKKGGVRMSDYVEEMHDYSDTMKNFGKNISQMELKDKTAKQNKKLVGRYIREKYADGYSFIK